jgi:glycosyltransferase involved in cell wall biosynthesis
MTTAATPRIAVLVPCYNEAVTVTKVVTDFRAALPTATIYVYDNNSTDATAELARAAGAVVVREKRQGKGFVLQAMFMDIVADYYVLVDGDDTYPADRVQELLAPLYAESADMVVGTRLQQFGGKSFRPLHIFGNRLVVGVINFIFGAKLGDVMSGYRAFNRHFVRSIPLVSKGFEIETELTLQALYRNMVVREVPVPYGERPAGSFSKLSTFRDGFRVLLKILDIFKAYRPLLFFTLVGGLFGGVGLALGSVPIWEYWETGLVKRFPTAFLAASLEIIAVVCVGIGLILDNFNHHFRELSNLVLRSQQNPPESPSR